VNKFVKISGMKKVLLLFILCFYSQQLIYSQSSFGIGLGVGHQFGLPGIRANYMWKRFDYSINAGLFGKPTGYPKWVNVENYQKFNYCISSGLSFRLNKKEGLFPEGIYPQLPNLMLNSYLTYNIGFIISHSYSSGSAKLFFDPFLIHSISINTELCFNYKFRARVGFGWALSSANMNYFPTVSLGGIYSIQKKSK
jgi:hypothetical protein